MAHEKPARRLVDQRGRRSRTLYRKLNKCKFKYLLVTEGAENDLLVRQCTFVHAAAYCHTRDATQRCQFSRAVLYWNSWWFTDSMFLWPCIMNWLYINYQLDALIIIIIIYSRLLDHTSVYRVTVTYAAYAQLYLPEDEQLRLETCRGEYCFMNK